MSEQHTISIEAVVTPVGHDEDGNLCMISLLTEDGGQYLVVDDAVGSITQDFRGEPVVKVESFTTHAT